jgi:hypothetical protein
MLPVKASVANADLLKTQIEADLLDDVCVRQV